MIVNLANVGKRTWLALEKFLGHHNVCLHDVTNRPTHRKQQWRIDGSAWVLSFFSCLEELGCVINKITYGLPWIKLCVTWKILVNYLTRNQKLLFTLFGICVGLLTNFHIKIAVSGWHISQCVWYPGSLAVNHSVVRQEFLKEQIWSMLTPQHTDRNAHRHSLGFYGLEDDIFA